MSPVFALRFGLLATLLTTLNCISLAAEQEPEFLSGWPTKSTTTSESLDERNIDVESVRLLDEERLLESSVGLASESNQIDSRQRESCKLIKIVHILKHPSCQSKAIESFACAGRCSSYVQLSIQLSTSKFWQHERSCSCCQQTGLQEATFTLDCPSLEPAYKKIKTYAPVDCLCRACTDLGRERLEAQELIEALGYPQSGSRN